MNFSPEQLTVIQSKHGARNQLFFAVMLKYFEENGRFPKQVDPELHQFIAAISKLLNLEGHIDGHWRNRSTERFKREIRLIFGFRIATLHDKVAFFAYCQTYIFPYAPRFEQTLEQAYGYFKEQKLEPYSDHQLQRFLSEAHYQFEQALFARISDSLSEVTKRRLDQLLKCSNNEDSIRKENAELEVTNPLHTISDTLQPINLVDLKDQRVDLKVNSITLAVQKHQYLKQLQLSDNLENKDCSRKLLVSYYERILTERPSSIARYQPERRYAYLVIFCYVCQQLSTDTGV